MSLSAIKDFFAIVQSVATVIAIIVGGVWTYWLFVRKRQSYPRAKIEHKISHRPTLGGKVLLSVDTIISNIGDVLISVESGRISVSQMLPPQSQLLNIIKGNNEVMVTNWQNLASQGTSKFEIEPGESHQLPYHFLIASDIQTIFVYTYFRNVEKPGRELGWEITTIYDIQLSGDARPSWLKRWILR